MSLLASVTTGRQIGAQIHTIAGVNGVGKTTWAASFPSPLIIDLEKGSDHLDVPRITWDKVNDLTAIRNVLKELATTPHTFKTVVIDSVEALEGLITDAVCKEGNVDSIEKYEGGYGKGYQRTREIMREIFGDLRALQAKGISSILVAHTQVKTITDPANNQTYDRVIMRCNDKMAAVVRDLSDNCYYATYKVFVEKDKNGKNKAFGDGQRVLFTQWRPGFDAKNRLNLPLELPLSYEAFAEAVTAANGSNTETLINEIKEMTAKIKDEKIKQNVKAALEKFKTNPTQLNVIKNKAMSYVGA